ncbi:Necrosis inducing protein (NPP1) [Streptomyces sp. S4.7]|nr:Necrosis inducing protein (NPP1) [Streptomyces sp. S4.7]
MAAKASTQVGSADNRRSRAASSGWSPTRSPRRPDRVRRGGNFDIHSRDQIRWDGTHPKVVYHKDGIGTHAFRAANSNDEPPENHHGGWQFPRLVGWNGYPDGLRDRLSQADFGSAVFGLKDGNFNGHLQKAKPAGIPFDPNA